VTDIRIEAAGKRHLAAIPGIELAAAAMFAEADLPLSLRYRVTDVADLRDAGADGRLWVALDAGRTPVGFVMADILDGNAHLDELDVLPEYGRQGIGTRLLYTFIRWARAEEFAAATLITFRHLPWNAPFYAKHGFETMRPAELGDDLRYMLDAEESAGLDTSRRVCMRLDLAATA